MGDHEVVQHVEDNAGDWFSRSEFIGIGANENLIIVIIPRTIHGLSVSESHIIYVSVGIFNNTNENFTE